MPSLERLETEVVACRRCPRLVEWREEVARTKRASYSDQTYWGRPVPGFGDPDAWLLIVGLAPGAHGANRTGRMFTGDRSGDWLYGSLHAAGLASQPSSEAREDGLTLNGVWITAVVRCAPPGNRPSTAERDACLPWLEAEIPLLTSVRVIVTLGGFAWTNTLRLLASLGGVVERPRPKFGHG
ncbi:MAG: uracil-DNA glycosylase, partial [marine benthic group bacterium]|nr:uracil-DNA glycosylase [Candidatus Carthagonibacter metallireducens]